MKIMKLVVLLIAVIVFVAACSHQRPGSSAIHTSRCLAVPGTNQPGNAFTTKDGSTFYLGAVTVNGTNVPMTDVQVK